MTTESLAPGADERTAVRSFDTLFVGGRFVPAAGVERMTIVSPATEAKLAEVPVATTADIDAAVASARTAFDEGPWPRMSAAERADALRRVAKELEARLPELSASFAAELGTPAAMASGFNAGAVSMWTSAADLLDGFVFEEPRPAAGGRAAIRREPVGVVAAITPWNAPVGNASIKLAPALAAGCTAVLKPAPEGAATALAFAEVLEAAGLPEGVVSVVPAGREVGEHLVRHPGVDKVTFTGSTAAGRRIMSLCGERITRVTLELGGKSACIVADGVDLSDSLESIVMSGIQHSGQVCAALTRILVPRERQGEIVAEIARIMEAIPVGDPFAEGTVLGPLAIERQRDRVEEYVRLGQDEGATLVTGGVRPEGLERGWYVAPTLFADVDNRSRIAQEEIFGPVLCVIPFDDIDEAVDLANDSDYGLSGAVYADDLELAERIAREVRTGQMWVNTWGMCVTEPFGGFKQSGLGREGGVEGIHDYLESKYLFVADRG
jgi:aldehyde dehydrogenase (NAD+)